MVSPVRRAGFTLAELTVAMTLGAVVGTAAVRLLTGTRRLHDTARTRVERQASLREGAAILGGQLRELAAGSAPAGDIVEMGPSHIVYRAAQGVYRLCRPPDGRLVLDAAPLLGDGWFDPAEYVLLAYDPTTGRWLVLEPSDLSADAVCPDGAPGMGVSLGGAPVPDLPTGTPLRAARLRELRLYQGGDGLWWIGGREYVRSTGTWATIQPIVGPVPPAGLLFTYLAADGSETGDPGGVARIGVSLAMGTAPGELVGAAFAVTLRNRAVP